MRTPMTLARGAITVTVFSTLTAILTSCASDNDKHTGGVQNPTCGLTQTLCKLDASTASTGPYCADLQTENANCGSCGNICHDGKVCSVGSCSAACQAGEKMCSADGTDAGLSHCVNPMNDNASCGDCGHPCAVGEVCSNGQCDLTCPTDETRCGADGDAGTGPYCANTRSDNANCGCCGNACGPNRRCQNGRCDDTTSFSFFVLGDMHVGPTSFNTTVQIAMNQMSQIDANVLTAFSNGDLVDVVSDAQWTEHDSFVSVPGFQLDEFCAASFGAQARYFSTVGDHDIGPANWNTLWNQHLPAQQNLGHSGDDGVYFSVKFANAFFIMLDSEHVTSSQASAQTSWLKSTLESADAQAAQFKFIFFHSPVYSCSSRHAPLAEALPWVDLAEQHNVNVIFGSHTHLYTWTCPKRGGTCTTDGAGVIFVETGAVGGLPRSVDKTSDTVSGSNAEGEARSDTYNCVVGQDLMAAHGLDNDFCHVRVEGCLATTKCYIVGDGNDTPFDTWTVNGCKCNNDDSDAGEMCDESTDGGAGN